MRGMYGSTATGAIAAETMHGSQADGIALHAPGHDGFQDDGKRVAVATTIAKDAGARRVYLTKPALVACRCRPPA